VTHAGWFKKESQYHGLKKVKSVSGSLYKAILFQSVCRKGDGKQCCFQFPAERRQWLDFPGRSWKGMWGWNMFLTRQNGWCKIWRVQSLYVWFPVYCCICYL